MKDLRSNLLELSRTLEKVPSHAGGRQIMVIGAGSGVGSSSVAASLGLLMAGRSQRSAWLIDLNLQQNVVFEGFTQHKFKRVGQPGRALDASLNTKQFYKVVPELRTQDGKTQGSHKYLGVHQIEGSKLYVSRFRTEHLKQGQKVQAVRSSSYWASLRRSVDWTIVDSPVLDLSRAGLAVVQDMDGVVIVMSADKTRVEQLNALRSEIESYGGHCLGIVVNKLKSDAYLADRIAI